MAANQKFDFQQAEALKTKLQSEIVRIEGDLKRMTTMVEGVKSWWSGGSEDAFINNFRSTKDQVVTSLNKWIEEYKQLIQQISTIKAESDADLARQLNR